MNFKPCRIFNSESKKRSEVERWDHKVVPGSPSPKPDTLIRLVLTHKRHASSSRLNSSHRTKKSSDIYLFQASSSNALQFGKSMGEVPLVSRCETRNAFPQETHSSVAVPFRLEDPTGTGKRSAHFRRQHRHYRCGHRLGIYFFTALFPVFLLAVFVPFFVARLG